MGQAGALQPMLDHAGMIADLGFGLAALVGGKLPFDPPVRLRRLLVRIVGLACGLTGLLIWWMRYRLDTDAMAGLTLASAITMLAATIVYSLAYSALCYVCPNNPTRYLGGLWLKREARAMLRGETPGGRYGGGPIQPGRPSGKHQMFCNSGGDPAHMWSERSIGLAGLLLSLLYAVVLLSGAAALSAGACLLMADQTKIESDRTHTRIVLPGDVLFDFDRSELRDEATPTLRRAAAILSDRGVRRLTIAGHTDARGDEAYNQRLSERRAAAVYRWLNANGALTGKYIRVLGFGAGEPRAPNIRPDGSDDPAGRALNRRVEIVIERDQ